jgi:hypothetical protein
MCCVATPLWAKCEDETHTPKSGNLESSRTPAISELNSKGQNTSPWGVYYIVGKVLKCRCPKWPCMSHLDICSPSYGQKKGRESLTTKSRESTSSGRLQKECDGALESSQGELKLWFSSRDLTPIRGQSQEIWVSKVPGVQPGTVSRLLLGSPGKKCHLDVAPAE